MSPPRLTPRPVPQGTSEVAAASGPAQVLPLTNPGRPRHGHPLTRVTGAPPPDRPAATGAYAGPVSAPPPPVPLAPAEWRQRAARHAERADALTAGHRARRGRDETHAVED